MPSGEELADSKYFIDSWSFESIHGRPEEVVGLLAWDAP